MMIPCDGDPDNGDMLYLLYVNTIGFLVGY